MDGAFAKLYFDGALINTLSYTSYVFNENIRIGSHDSNYYLTGSMKNIKVFNRVLSAEEVKIEYNTILNDEMQIHDSGILYIKDIKQY